MEKSKKIDKLLETTLEKLIKVDPSFLLDLIVTPGDPKDIEALVQYIEESGGKPKQVRPEAVSCQVPAGQVHRLAESNLVSALRLARLHRMH